MIDLTLLRKDPERVAQAWSDRGVDVSVPDLVALDEEVRRLKHETEQVRAEAKLKSKAIGQVAAQGGDISAAREEARRLGDVAKELDEQRALREDELQARLLHLPNLCLPEVPVGRDESANAVVGSWGEQPNGIASPKAHWDLAPALGIIDFERGAAISGSGFVVYRGAGARLQRALINFFLDTLGGEFGYNELMPPILVKPETMQGTGQLPKFAEDAYKCEGEGLYLIPTAEVPVTNFHAGEILPEAELPLRYCAYTPCFRREAGAAGVGTRGITRMHQFDKVEMVWLTHPDRSGEDLLTLRSHAEHLLQALGLHYRILELCTGDTGFSSARTFDLEVWSAGTGTWLEVSSCSNFTDFQARRAGIRFRGEKGSKPNLVHTLNGSGLALPRTVIAILESYQQNDGSVVIPEVLRPYMGGLEVIEAAVAVGEEA